MAFSTFKRRAELLGVYEPNQAGRGINKNSGWKKIPLKEILVENSTYTNTHNLKKYLLEEGLLEEKCKCCGIGNEWNGKPLSLQLDHENGVHNDHRINNLRLLCPNCHSQTDTYAGKNARGTKRQD